MKNNICVTGIDSGETELWEYDILLYSNWQDAVCKYGGTFKYDEGYCKGIERYIFDIIEPNNSDYPYSGLVKMTFLPDYDHPSEEIIHYGDVIMKYLGSINKDGTMKDDSDGHMYIRVMSTDTFYRDYECISDFILNLCDIAEIKIREFINSIQY